MDIFIRLKVQSDQLTSDELESLIGIVGSRKWNRGEVRPKSKIVEKINGWLLETEYKSNEEIQVCLNDFFLNLGVSAKKKIAALESKANILISCIVYVEVNQFPCLYIENETLKEIVLLGSDLDIDIYQVGNHE